MRASRRPKYSDLIYDWNRAGGADLVPARGRVELDDETLRDGLQSPSVVSPSIEDKLRILHMIAELGIEAADIGLPGAGPHVAADVLRLAQEIVDAKLKVAPNCAARTVVADTQKKDDISQAVGIPIEVAAFIGSSPIRQYAEGWTMDRMLKLSEEAVAFAVGHGLPVMFVTEDTTRAAPDDLRRLHTAAIIKARARGEDWLADRVYSSVPASLIGCRQVIEVGPMSGESNVVYWLQERGIDPAKDLVAEIFQRAKGSPKILAEEEILAICQARGLAASPPRPRALP